MNRYRQYGPNYGVASGANYGVIGGPGPSAQSNPTEYPPTLAGNFVTSILPRWIAAAVGLVAGQATRMQAPNNARGPIPQQFRSNAVGEPTNQPYPAGLSPRLYAQATKADTERPGTGSDGPQVYSTTAARMDVQPAFEIDPPQNRGRVITNLFEGLNGFPGGRQGLPTWFPLANRSNLTNLGRGTRWGGPCVEYLVVPPDRYRRPNRAQPVRAKTGRSRGNISSALTPPVPFGS